MKDIKVVILSGSCCNPMLLSVDEKIKERILSVANDNGYNAEIKVITITSAAFGGLGLGKQTGDAVKSLISEKGLSILPIVVFNGNIAFYGGLVSAQLVKEKMLTL